MVQVRVAHTCELDDSAIAIRDIVERLDLATLSSNAVGVVTCEKEFIDNGIMQVICANLPFECVGCTTTLSAVPGAADPQQLNVLVLSGDDISFSLGLSTPFGTEHESCVHNLYNATRSRLDATPSMSLVFAPMLFDAPIDDERMATLISEAVGDIPVFGTLACNYVDGEYIDNGILHNGEYYSDRAAMILIGGDIHPRFTLASIPENRILKQKAVITKSRGSLLIEVNDKPVLEYLESLGLIINGQFVGAHAYPFIIHKGNGEEASTRTIYGVTPEGYLKCGRKMPLGASLSIGAQDIAAVRITVEKVLSFIDDEKDINAAIFFSCHSRSVTLGLEERLEIDLIEKKLGDKAPYMFAYSGGEICPYTLGSGKYRNCFHSDTIVACIL